MTDTDPKMDFRYKMGETEIEGYQITPASRWQQEKWPSWLVMQRLPDDTNALYSAGDGSDNLILALPSGDFVLPPMAWVVKSATGSLEIVEAMDMEAWVKVVPVPEPKVHPPADGIPDKADVVALKPVATLENVAGDTNELRNEMLSAIKMLQDVGTDGEDDLPPKAEEALAYLKHRLAVRTLWCTCAPGQCAYSNENAKLNIASCRQNSPLVN